ncbi:hypothetical protein FA15DRAFT_707989 [Coprinopsis marcescibilis]|uniref:CBM1 domain-containing protein n=1 Tax=Coprinopsis marcescibilis TaxID=230819 RepID=A0A5C3KKV9_COPMA|nr:hypothetical protein FA15DRAFT_707989 [Coprinopsis marcescibilis]
MDNCFDLLGLPDSCTQLTQQPDADMSKCVQPTRINERVEGVLFPELPGSDPIQTGPDQATMIRDCKTLSTTGFGNPVTPVSPISTVVILSHPLNPAHPLLTRFGQCGGQGWSGPTQCVAPLCLPGHQPVVLSVLFTVA